MLTIATCFIAGGAPITGELVAVYVVFAMLDMLSAWVFFNID